MSYSHVEKSIIKNKYTNQNETSLVFKKIIDNNKVRMVALRLFKDKTISMRTLYTV